MSRKYTGAVLGKYTGAVLAAGLWFVSGSVARAGLIGLYTFNGNANDSSGNGNNGTVFGSVSYTSNAPFGGQALTLDGTTRANYVRVPIDSTVSGQPVETFGAWFFVPNPADTSTIRGLISNDDGSFDRTIDEDTRSGGFQYSLFAGSLVPGGAVTQGQFVFVAASYDNTGGNNGSYVFQVGANQFAGTTAFDGGSVAGATFIGINPNFDSEFQGEIADAFFCSNALNASQLNTIQAKGPSAIAAACGSVGTAPEPGSMALLGIGLLLMSGGLVAARRLHCKLARR
jgi:hypothetical protein